MFVLFEDKLFNEKNQLYKHLEELLSLHKAPHLNIPIKVQDRIDMVCITGGKPYITAIISFTDVSGNEVLNEIIASIENIIPEIVIYDASKSYLELKLQSKDLPKLVNQLGVIGSKILAMQSYYPNLNYSINLTLSINAKLDVPIILSYSTKEILSYLLNYNDRVGVIYITQSSITSVLTQTLLQFCMGCPDVTIIPLGCSQGEIIQIRNDLKFTFEENHIYFDKSAYSNKIRGVPDEELYLSHR